MTNGRGAGMASFMTKKKKYKFQVEVCLDELLEVPFVSAVLFAKLRLLDGGNFQDHSRRQEVCDHTVKWDAHYSFPCKMLANASTGVLERCVLRVSVRKECKGGKSFTKLGFVDLNLAEYAGAGETCKKALLEGYDARHRSDNSMLRFSIKMNMLSGDILFKVPSPSLKHKSVVANDDAVVVEPRIKDEFSGGSLGGSASGSSGFGSLPKKRPALLSSELLIGHTLQEGNVPVTVAIDSYDCLPTSAAEAEEHSCEPGHSRNSSNTSQMSKASGYSSIHSHSRQSSSGDSGHIREQLKSKRVTTLNIPSTFPEDANSHLINNNHIKANSQTPDEMYATPEGCTTPAIDDSNYLNHTAYFTPKNISTVSDDFRTPSTPTPRQHCFLNMDRNSLDCVQNHENRFFGEGVLRSKSDFEIPRRAPVPKHEGWFFQNIVQGSDNLLAFLTPMTRRRMQKLNEMNHSTPLRSSATTSSLKVSPIPKVTNTRTTSLNSLQSTNGGQEMQILGVQPIPRGLPHRKLLEGGAPGGKLAPVAISPDEATTTVSSDCSQTPAIRRPSVTQNPSSGSLVLSETGSLDRAKAALERRKKNQPQEPDVATAPGRVEGTRVNPDHLIDELIKNTNIEQADDSAESSGLQLFIAKDGTAALGSHEVKSQMSAGVFKQVVMEDNR